MINRILITTCVVALFTILTLNVLPFFYNQNVGTYVRQDEVSGMAIRHDNQLFTLNFDQQKQVIDILNRAIPIGKIDSHSSQPLTFDQIVIYRFKESPILLTPINWSQNNNLYFQAPQWTSGYLREVSDGQLYQILAHSYYEGNS